MTEWWQKAALYKKHRTVRRILDRIARIISDIGDKRVGNLSASLTYYSILAFFPFVIALVAVVSLFVNESNISQASEVFVKILPSDLANLLIVQLQNAIGQSSSNLVVAIVAIIISVISVSGVVGSVLTALSVIYGHKERRSFIARRVIGLVVALGFIIGTLAVIAILLIGRNIFDTIGLSGFTRDLISVGLWAVLAVLISTLFGTVYHYGRIRQRRPTKKRFYSIGTLIPSAVWIIVSISFFWYLSNVTNLTRSYSLFAGVIGMMLWFHVTYYVMLVGACIDKQLKI